MFDGLPNNLTDSAGASERSIWGFEAQEKMLACKGRSNVFDICKDCLASILGKRETRNSRRLTGYADRAPIPIDIIELHRHDIAGAQPEPS